MPTMGNENNRNGGPNGTNPHSNNTINGNSSTISMRESPLKYRKVIVFIAGGVTYEEYCSVEMNFNSPHSKYKGDFHVLLGGSFIHNSQTFLQTFFNMDEYVIQQSNNIYGNNFFGSPVIDASSQPPQMYQQPPPTSTQQGYGPPSSMSQPPNQPNPARGRMNNQGYQRV
jgi:hypothetical protein